LFLLLAACWGTSFVAIEIGLHYFPPLLFAGIRYVAAGAIMLAYAYATTERWRPATRAEWIAVAVSGALIIGAYHGFLYLGELRVSGAVAAIVISLTPVLTAACASAMLPNERLGAVEVAGLLLGLVGVVVIAAPNPSSVSPDAAGVALVFLAAAAFAVGSVATRPLRTDLPSRSMQAWSMLLGSGALLVAGAARGESLAAIEWTLPAAASFLYLTLVSGVVGFLLYFELLGRVGPTELNLVGYLEPVVAAAVSWVLLGHTIDSTAATGFVAIFAGFSVLKRDALYEFALSRSALARDS
jgi:drug/metabolite transporter (DMT)-like permease